MGEIGDQSEGDESAADAFFEGVQKKLEEKNQRRKTASVVRDWLEAKESDLRRFKGTRIQYRDMAEDIGKALSSGEIIFAVKDPEKSKLPIKTGVERRKKPKEQTVFDREMEYTIVVLTVRGDVTKDELLEKGEVSFERLWKLHQDYGVKQNRLSADAAVDLGEGYGRFPKLDE